jgi:hypothetical protein
VIEPIPHADEADIAKQARAVDDGIDERDTVPDELDENQDADAGDLLEEQLPVSAQDDGGGAAAGLATSSVFWPAWESNSLRTQRSFIDDMASLNQSYRPDW